MTGIDRFYADAADLAENPVGCAVLVVGTRDEAIARQAAPLVAGALHPTRRYGPVIHAQRIERDRWEVVVRDLGPARGPILSTKGTTR